jgi:hypothetical protein
MNSQSQIIFLAAFVSKSYAESYAKSNVPKGGRGTQTFRAVTCYYQIDFHGRKQTVPK